MNNNTRDAIIWVATGIVTIATVWITKEPVFALIMVIPMITTSF